MDAAEKKCSVAKALVDAELDGLDDDDFGASPQSILLSTMYMDPSKSQRDSAVLLPSLKFLWETYRAVLDILRSNSKLEHVYHVAAQNALRFCRTYRRRMEFRHLTDMLRTHLGNLRQHGNLFDTEESSKTSNKVRGWDGWNAESIEMHLQTRFAQLETASVLHRYTEGFRTCEDIFNILQISQARRKIDPDAPPPKAKLMASYYEKLTTLFWVSENYLFHAYAWFKYYALRKEYNRGMSEETTRMLASAVLLAALCIPSLPQQAGFKNNEKQHGIASTIEDDIVKQKMARMSTLLGFHTRNPTREALLTEIRSKDLLGQVPEYLRKLYFLFEENSDPLIMVEQAQPLLEHLKKEIGNTIESGDTSDDVEDTTLGRYVKPLTSVLLLKLIVNLSKAYHTVSIDFLKSLTAGLEMSFEQVEKSLVLFTQTKALSVRIDHRAGCLRFGDTQLESIMMRSQLTNLSKQLEAISHELRPKDNSEIIERRAAMYSEIRDSLASEHSRIIERKNLIEQRKELEERVAQEKQRQEERRKAEEEAERRKEEELRIKREHQQREREKQLKIQQELENKEKMRYLEAMGQKAEEISEAQIAAMKTEELERKHQEEVNRKKEEAERKTKEAAKKLDYLVRAIRIESLPLIRTKYKEKVMKDRERYEHETVEKAKKAKEQWEEDVRDKTALEAFKVFEHISKFEDLVMAGRKVAHRTICKEAEEAAEVEAEKEKINRARKRRDDERKRIADEEKRAKEEAERRQKEEEERAKEDERRAQEAKEQAKRDTETQRQEEEDRKSQKTGKYVPPALRGKGGTTGSKFGGDEFSGGGRYTNDRRAGGLADDRGDSRGFGDRRGGFGERREGGYGDRREGGFGDRREGGFGGDRRGADDRGFGGGRSSDERPRLGDRGGTGERPRFGERGAGDRGPDSSRK